MFRRIILETKKASFLGEALALDLSFFLLLISRIIFL
mgnify:CR=1 FL=1